MAHLYGLHTLCGCFQFLAQLLLLLICLLNEFVWILHGR